MSPVACSYFSLRVVPHPYTGAGVPVAVVLQSRPAEFLGIRAVTDADRLRALAPDVDLELLGRYLRSYQAIADGDPDAGEIALLSRPERFHWMAAPRSDVLQPSETEHAMAEEPAALLDRLFAERVESRMGAFEPRLETLAPRRLVGMHRTMTLAENRTAELWRAFGPRRKEIVGVAGPELYSVEVYPPGWFDAVDPLAPFEKWAAVAVSGDDVPIPDGMAALDLPGGLHAVFTYRGAAREGEAAYRHIYGQWLPASEYVLSDRPHLAIMGGKYRGDDPASEEEIWIPVQPTD